MEKCKFCKKDLTDLKMYPHLSTNLFKKGVNTDNIPVEILEDLPNPHLHVYYECKDCNYKLAVDEVKLIGNMEVDNLIKKGIMIKPSKTVEYWKNWLKGKK